MNHQPDHRKAKISKSCPPSLRIEDTEQLLKEFYRESLSSIETDHWLDLMDSESNSAKRNSNPYLDYFNDVDTAANFKLHGAEYDLIQKIEKQKIQEDSRNAINCEDERNKNWEDGNNQHEELPGIESQPQAYDSYNEGKDWQCVYTLGCGKFGEVTLVYDKNKKLTCAAKKVPKKYYRREELEIWRSLKATNIVQLLGAVRHGDFVTFFMELVNGDNILLSDTEQRLLLCDFTFAKKLPLGQFTPKGEAPVGTPTHMAPEVALSAGHDWRADVWSATCTFLHMINGRHPWVKKFADIYVLLKVIAEESPPYFEIPPSCHILVDSLIKRGLMVNQYERPFAATLRDEAADVMTQISGLQFIFGEQYAEVSSPLCNENMSEYPSQTKLELSSILKDLKDPSPGSDLKPESENKVNEVQLVVGNTSENQQSLQRKIEDTTEKEKKNANSSKPCGANIENQISTSKRNQQFFHGKVKRLQSCPVTAITKK
ncbi:hypothetical protein scyTo_0016993 [Scyliorhinus torazame]|uniref:Protein kinase domain-containing protein n=1 Tax=Scyliorhinus torazame TaxID=75743 RepID=A0A401Q2V1_SCYTO|nr:hypothetical protein [Scyliorhinus torazame]